VAIFGATSLKVRSICFITPLITLVGFVVHTSVASLVRELGSVAGASRLVMTSTVGLRGMVETIVSSST
jgi:hypothetical protein